MNRDREMELAARLEEQTRAGSALGKGLSQGVTLARSLAETNASLRTAFDQVVAQRDEMEAAHGLLMVEARPRTWCTPTPCAFH